MRLEGSRWEPHGTVDVGEGVGATGKGTTVVTSGSKFFWSDNLSVWQEGAASVVKGTPLASPAVLDLVVGYPNRGCP